MRVAIAALAVAILAGCSGGSFTEQEKEVKAEVARYFAELNAEAGARAQQAKATRTDIDLPPTSLVLNQYEWDLAGSVYPNVTCHQCQTNLGTRATATGSLLCPECGADLVPELTRIGRGVPMFEIKSGNSLPIVVVVRYIRRSLAYDPNSAVLVSQKADASFPVKAFTDADQRGHGAYYAGGFYRVTGASICRTGFVYRGGELRQIDPESVKKMTKDPPETVAVSAMKLGRSGALEDPLTPWIKGPSAKTPKEAPKSP